LLKDNFENSKVLTRFLQGSESHDQFARFVVTQGKRSLHSANADGGELLIGVEDDGTLSGNDG
jgi:hypothetical protein